ncbi:MAG: TonB family protein [Pseudomonadota bacterium]
MTELLIGLGLEPAVIGPWITALGWALVHFVWQGALLGAAFAAGCWLLRGGSPEYRYWLGLGCLAAMALAPLATFTLLLESSGTLLFTDTASLQVWADPAIAAVAAGTGLAPETVSLSLEQALPWIVGIWALGVLAMSTRVAVNWTRLIRLSRVGILPISEELEQRVEALKQSMGVRQAVRVVETTVAQVPTVLGWLRPMILLPTSTLVGLSPAQLDLVIAHELGHIRRLDFLINLFQVLVETLLFYHPMVRWVSRRVREEREQCCDDMVVAVCGNRIQYARALANLESMRSPQLEPALAATGGQLVQRIERIVCTHRQRDNFSANSGVVFVIAGLLVLAAQLADPIGVFEDRRSRLAEALMSELQAEQALGESTYAPLAEARVIEPVEPASSPAASTAADSSVVTRDAEPEMTQIAVSAAGADADRATSTPAAASAAVVSVEIEAAAPAPTFTAPAVKPWTPPVSYDNAVAVPTVSNAEPLQVATAKPLAEPLATKPAESLMNIAPAPAPERAAPAAASQPSGPVAIRRMSPEYPVRARVSGQQGFVELTFSVTPDGRVEEVRVLDSWPRRVFDRSAKRAIKGWRFDPATVTGQERLNQRFEFSLAGSELPSARRDACLPLTGTRICRQDSPTALMAEAANQK